MINGTRVAFLNGITIDNKIIIIQSHTLYKRHSEIEKYYLLNYSTKYAAPFRIGNAH